MIESCCYGCTERKVGCHSKCEKYKDFKTKLEEERAKEKARINKHNSGYYHN